ncbi:acyltransferase family protein [Micromonospora sp. WMMD980]|uniref:acyltransferase family protein n=1 Tax=Micromonospora sp. WMMD980 TaxID=3016088 RepID=UPI002415AC0A|nr:acyltransferase family protein [Micromonospora sp. WMMD980]MDG4801818.1 acyltransferase family protein [Micromonospora sp. WMMD980]
MSGTNPSGRTPAGAGPGIKASDRRTLGGLPVVVPQRRQKPDLAPRAPHKRSKAPIPGRTMTQTASRPTAAPPRGTPFRGDIEGLRALAVIMVLVGHAGSQFVPGGFVGVDVFFVISGFLITGLLVEELDRTGQISLVGFYARRAKRLLPAACLVLLVTLLLTYLFLPRVRFANTAWDVVSSALYVMNWRLAAQSVDYMFVDQAPSILQHYWSLSVEEQFYLFWPLLLLGLAVLGGRRRRGVLMIGFAVVALPSFVWSIHLTSADPAPAYFVTTTRLWELALGGAVAIAGGLLHRTPRPLAALLAWSGLAAVIASAFLLSSASAFPGYVALLPTGGTAAVIAFAVAAGRAGPAALLGLHPMRLVGALSYSLYLWHWPLLIIADYQFGELAPTARLAVVAASAVPAALTYRFVENPIRRSSRMQWEPEQALKLGAVCTGGALIAGLIFQLTVWPAAQPPTSAVARPPSVPSGASASSTPSEPAGPLGAAVLRADPRDDPAGRPVDRVPAITPDPLVAAKDQPESALTGCHVQQSSSEPLDCVYGIPEASYTVVLAGDSHAAQWLPALQEVAAKRKWRIVSHTKSSCPFLAMEVALAGRPYRTRTEWNRRVREQLRADPPDLLVVSNSLYLAVRDGKPVTERVDELLADGLRATWREMTDVKIPVVVLRDTPYHRRDQVECVSANPDRLTRCASSRDAVLSAGGGAAQERAAQGQSGVHLVNLNDAICPTDRCAAVIGGVLVYRDSNHLTATYARTLAPRLDRALMAVSPRGT